MKVSAFIRLLEQRGFVLVRQKGSHRQYRRKGTPTLLVTVAGKPSSEIDKGTLSSMLKQAGLSKDDL